MNDDVKVLAHPQAINRLTRRSVLAGLAAVGVGVLTGCQASKKVAANVPVDGTLESKLNIYSWGDYDDPDLLKEFRKQFDVLLQVDSYGSNEELAAKLAASRGTSGYDIVVPTGSMLPLFTEHNLLQPLDLSLIPNLSTMDPNFLKQDFDPDNKYTICKDWGTTGFVYDKELVKSNPTSWKDFIEVVQGAGKKKTSLLEDPWEVTSVALAAKGYDLNTIKKSELAEAEKIVVDQLAPNVKAYTGNAATAMAQGGFAILQAFNGDARLGMLEDDNPDRWQFVFPTEGANRWMDCWSLASGAPHPDSAHAFINWIIAPEQAKKETDYIGYATGSKVFLDKKVEESFDLPEIIFPTQGVLSRLTPSVFNEGQQARVDIFTNAQARSGV